MQINYLKFMIETKDANLSVRDFLMQYNVSRKNIYKQELYNLIRVNGTVVKLNYQLKENDELTFKLAPIEGVIEPFEAPIDIVYEDEDIILVNKKAKLLIHDDGQTKNTLTNHVSYYFHQKGYDYPVLPVHRLDYETSGLVLFAKHFISLSFLSAQFEKKEIKRTYVAVCNNYFTKLDGVIDYRIGKDRHSNKQIVIDSGKEARTEYFVIEQAEKVSKVELIITSGRTHQIRVHLAYIGHPIVGDKLYGKTKHERLLLHFKKIGFVHPRYQKMVFFTSKESF